MKKIMAVLAFVVVTAVAGCSGDSSPGGTGSDDRVQQEVLETEYGTYLCFVYTTVHRGGIWCEQVEGAPT